MKITVIKVVDENGHTSFLVNSGERDEMNCSFKQDDMNIYSEAAYLAAATVLGLLERENPVTKKVQGNVRPPETR